MTMNDSDSKRRNPVFWLIFLLPGAAVVGGLATVFIAYANADRALPQAYHWEGDALDADFARARQAAELGVRATLEVAGAEQQCRVRLEGADPAAVLLLLTHSDDAAQDRQLRLPRLSPGLYQAPCAVLPAARWRISLDDESGRWSIRAHAEGVLARVELTARDPHGNDT